jgi:hypothetical protein
MLAEPVTDQFESLILMTSGPVVIISEKKFGNIRTPLYSNAAIMKHKDMVRMAQGAQNLEQVSRSHEWLVG